MKLYHFLFIHGNILQTWNDKLATLAQQLTDTCSGHHGMGDGYSAMVIVFNYTLTAFSPKGVASLASVRLFGQERDTPKSLTIY